MRPQIPWVGGLGTWGLKQPPEDQWDRGESVFSRFLGTEGFVNAGASRPFRGWSTDVDGPPLLGDNDWEPGADAFIDWLIARGLVGSDLQARQFFVAILHSHCGNVGLTAASFGLQLPAVVLVATPIVKRIERDIVPKAMPRIGLCLHLSDARIDWTALAGQLFDRRVSWRRTYAPETGIVCEQAPGIGHSSLLSDPRVLPLWTERGWLERLRAAAAVQTFAPARPRRARRVDEASPFGVSLESCRSGRCGR